MGRALSLEQQVFVSGNLMTMHKFLATDAGRAAVALFVEEWQKGCGAAGRRKPKASCVLDYIEGLRLVAGHKELRYSCYPVNLLLSELRLYDYW